MSRAQKRTWMTAVFTLLAATLVVYAFFQVRAGKNVEGKKPMTEVEKLLDRDLEANYPGNAREVVKFYNRILKCFYNEELSEEELKGLSGQVRILFDTELLKRNPADTYLDNLKEDIAEYKEAKRTIINIKLQDYQDISFETRGEDKTASLLCYYLMKEGVENRKSYLRYYLREDEEGRWRILFWELSPDSFE